MPPRRRRTPQNDGAELRREILAELRDCLGPHAEREGALYDQLIGPLERGEAVQVHRYDLPEWHPERFTGEPYDSLLLDEHNTLRDI